MNIFIAGYEDLTQNYRNALKSLGAETACLPPKSTCTPQSDSPAAQQSRALQLQAADPCTACFPSPEMLSRYFDGLLLPGGGDIHPGLFGEKDQGSLQVDLPLDQFQLSVFYAFCQAEKPILGICKGMQLINVALGGTIFQDLPKPLRRTHAWAGKDQTHATRILPGTFLHSLYGDQLVTNSAHHQAVNRLGTCLLPAQYSSDQVLEGLFHASLPILAVQWHPERMQKDQTTGDGSLVLAYFLSLCSVPLRAETSLCGI